ncbi:MAG: alpha/beta hydrolase [Candidatus Omnitrophica bacterium]|nr:alpha/beta hydrolase [Candidatus Omnitrophota bacterium]
MPGLVALLSGLALGAFTWGAFGSSRVLHQARYRPGITPQDLGLSYEPLSLKGEGEIPLSGWLIRHPDPTGILLLFHGYGTGKADLLDIACALHRQGRYHLLLFDFRGHGFSGGRSFSFGLREVGDIGKILQFLAGQAALQGLPVGCYGISMGGAIGLLSASRFPEIRAVASDASYARLDQAIARAQWLNYHIPRVPLGQMVIWGTELRLGTRLSRLNPVEAVKRISPRGVMVIHGMSDLGIPPEEGELIFQAAGEPKELWLVPQAEHVGSFYKEPEEYIRRVVTFFDRLFSRAA